MLSFQVFQTSYDLTPVITLAVIFHTAYARGVHPFRALVLTAEASGCPETGAEAGFTLPI